MTDVAIYVKEKMVGGGEEGGVGVNGKEVDNHDTARFPFQKHFVFCFIVSNSQMVIAPTIQFI